MADFKIGWFSTGRDKAARDLLNTVYKDIGEGNIPQSRISFVFCSRERGEGQESDLFIQEVQEKEIPLVCFSSSKFRPGLRKENLEEWRLSYDREVMKLISSYSCDLIVLAGYMLVVGKEMCQNYPMINLHPARPGGPKGSWQEVIWQLIKSRSLETGAMMHLVTPELDEGPPVTYCVFKIKNGIFSSQWEEIQEMERKDPGILERGVKAVENTSLFHRIREKGLVREFPLISYTLKVFAEGRVKIKDHKIFNSEGRLLEKGYDLTEMINKKVGG